MASDNNIKTVSLTDPQTKREVFTSSLVKMEGAGYHGFQDTFYDADNKLIITEDTQTKLTFTNPSFVKEYLPQIGSKQYPLYDFTGQRIMGYEEFENALCRIRIQFVAENLTAAAGQGVRVSLYDVAQGFSYDRNTVALIKAANQPQRVRELMSFYVSPETFSGLEVRITPLNGDIRIYNANLLISYNM